MGLKWEINNVSGWDEATHFRLCARGSVPLLSACVAPEKVISVRGVRVDICLSLCAGCWAFHHCETFFWQLSSLDLDSISLDRKSSGFLKERKTFFFPRARSPASLCSGLWRHLLKCLLMRWENMAALWCLCSAVSHENRNKYVKSTELRCFCVLLFSQNSSGFKRFSFLSASSMIQSTKMYFTD